MLSNLISSKNDIFVWGVCSGENYMLVVSKNENMQSKSFLKKYKTYKNIVKELKPVFFLQASLKYNYFNLF